MAIVATALQPKCLTEVQELVFRQTWLGQTYVEISQKSGYEPDYINYVGFQLWQILSQKWGLKVNKKNIHSVLKHEAQYIKSLAVGLSDVTATSVSTATQQVLHKATTRQDWKEAIEVSQFYGRSAELTTLEQSILRDRCRLVVILGMGGIGKTALAAKLAEQIQDRFEYLIWFSLRNSPPIDDVLAKSIRFLSNQQETELPARLDEKIARLMNYLRASPCLLVLDHTEQILQSGENGSDRSASLNSQCYAFASPTGSYQPGYEGYGQLLRCIALSPID